MFQPKTYLDLTMAMKTRAEVKINGFSGTVQAIRFVDHFAFEVTLQPPAKRYTVGEEKSLPDTVNTMFCEA